MESKDNTEPPGKRKRRQSVKARIRGMLNIFSEEVNTSEKKDELIKKSVEEFSTSLASADNELGPQARDMIIGIVDISSTTTKEIMVPRVDIVGVESGSAVRDIIDIVKESGHSRVPVYEESLDTILGILYVKDLFVRGLKESQLIDKSMFRAAYFVPENKKVSDLLKEMQSKKIHLAIVVDEYGGTAGLVTLEDILEEIVGEIEDEYDLDAPAIKKLDDRHYAVKGSVAIYELNEELQLQLPEDQFETVGGVIYDLVGSLPSQGAKVTYKGISFIADRVEGQRITRVIVETPPPKLHKEEEQEDD
jgi:CBS domain containing-hemolysin-like protein